MWMVLWTTFPAGGVVLVQEHGAPDGWGQFQDVLRAEVSKGNWDTWLSRLEPEFVGDAPTLVAPSEFHLRWVRDKHGDLIESAFRDVFGHDVRPHYKVIEPEPIVEQTLPLEERPDHVPGPLP